MARKDTSTADDTASKPAPNGAQACGLSDVGQVRQLNEDNYHWEPLDEDLALFAVADGMGGHEKGEVASKLAIDTLFSVAQGTLPGGDERDLQELQRYLRNAFQEANRSVVTTSEEEESNTWGGDNALVANVGDSRVYMVREGDLVQISQDHSLVGYLVQLGELSEEEARNHPSGNILVRSIGSVSEVEIDLYHVKVNKGDRLMLCSDGLWGEVEDAELAALMDANQDPSDACSAMITAANDHGGKDNTTLIVVNV